ncbi:response regulator transcription factor [Spirochaeta isovalerica]|uniref:DNA-binding response OmpR family regulator n=1 Tax=Spirochaeta isovalerica TaxID=150 RepID=A0A841RES4_9SPIO|nr:response regulator transcription factor [Spirochaeta isovalerica]MBB6482116.1 DNA-binding response OmpR family regulator [Spirochaeta isovalerica]
MNEKTILIVDDEKHILTMLEMNMKARGFNSLTAESGEEALEIALKKSPDLILLDIMLPGIDGVEVCRRLKEDERTKRIPVLMVSAKSEGKDKITGLKSGADDYVTKPFNLEELYLRINAALRQVELLTSSPVPVLLSLGNITLDKEKFLVRAADEKIELTQTEFRILLILLQHKGLTVSRERLAREIFDLSPEEMGRTLDVHIRNLRKKLDEKGARGCEIITIRGEGFKAG